MTVAGAGLTRPAVARRPVRADRDRPAHLETVAVVATLRTGSEPVAAVTARGVTTRRDLPGRGTARPVWCSRPGRPWCLDEPTRGDYAAKRVLAGVLRALAADGRGRRRPTSSSRPGRGRRHRAHATATWSRRGRCSGSPSHRRSGAGLGAWGVTRSSTPGPAGRPCGGPGLSRAPSWCSRWPRAGLACWPASVRHRPRGSAVPLLLPWTVAEAPTGRPRLRVLAGVRRGQRPGDLAGDQRTSSDVLPADPRRPGVRARVRVPQLHLAVRLGADDRGRGASCPTRCCARGLGRWARAPAPPDRPLVVAAAYGVVSAYLFGEPAWPFIAYRGRGRVLAGARARTFLAADVHRRGRRATPTSMFVALGRAARRRRARWKSVVEPVGEPVGAGEQGAGVIGRPVVRACR